MNERLLELAKQAGLKKDHGSDREYIGDFDWRTFADLVVQECIDVAMSEMVSADELEVEETDDRAYLLGNNGGILDAVGAIRLHFQGEC